MAEEKKMVGKSTPSQGENEASNEPNGNSSATTTEPNGGTRSSPPRVGGTGLGEAQGVKARSASVAKNAATENDATKNTPPTSSTAVKDGTESERDAG